MTGYFGVSEVSPFNGHSEGTFKPHWHLCVLMLDPSRQVEAGGDSPVSQMRCGRETPTDPFGPVEEENHLWNMTTAMDNDPFSSICLWNMVIFRSSLKLSDELLLAFHLWDAMGFNRKSDAKLLAIIVWQDESKTFNCCSVLALLKAWKIGERRTWNEAGLCLLRRACVKYVLVWVYLAF